MHPLAFDISTHDLIKIGLGVFCGSLLGFERQYKNKTAGFRTIILICLGSTIFTMIAQRAGLGVNINLVTGIGFIGAGVIFKDNIAVSGLTTAAIIWISAAIGMAAGSGNYMLAIICTLLTLTVLLVFSEVEKFVDKVHRDKLFVILFNDADYHHITRLEETVRAENLKAKRIQVTKKDGCLQIAILVTGHRSRINKIEEKLLGLPQVRSF